jgi:lipopolysaccharide transport system permease protein
MELQRTTQETLEERVIEPPGLIPPDLGAILIFAGIWRNWGLVSSLSRREIEARYRGSWLGFLWPVLQPLMLLGVYTFIFSFVFGARWPGIYESDVAGYSIVIFSGLVTFNIFAESVRSCPKLIVSNRTFVQRVVFPLEVLPVVQIVASLVHATIGLIVMIVFMVLSGAPVHLSAMGLPLVWLGFAAFSLGICYVVTALSVFVRDFEPLVAIGITALFFGSAIFYPLERLPDDVEVWARLMPTAAAVDLSRRLLLLGEVPGLDMLVGPGLVSLATLLFGYVSFMKVKGRFADAL